RTLIYTISFISVYQVPVNVFDLANRRNYLLAKAFFSNLLVISCRTEETQIQAASESLKQMLPDRSAEGARQKRIESDLRTVGGLSLVVEGNLKRRTGGKSLRVSEITSGGMRLG